MKITNNESENIDMELKRNHSEDSVYSNDSKLHDFHEVKKKENNIISQIRASKGLQKKSNYLYDKQKKRSHSPQY